MNASLESELEAQLLAIGSQERRIVERISTLSAAMKEAVQHGDLPSADAYYEEIMKLKSALKTVEPIISRLETKLYGLRLRKKT